VLVRTDRVCPLECDGDKVESVCRKPTTPNLEPRRPRATVNGPPAPRRNEATILPIAVGASPLAATWRVAETAVRRSRRVAMPSAAAEAEAWAARSSAR